MANLTEICANLKNYFLTGKNAIKKGTFTVVSGTAPLASLLPNQYFCIRGSILNDGVWQNTAEDLANLQNEEFTGEIWSMSVPRDFEKLCDDINAWRKENEGVASPNMSPYTSESFGGYSYSKGGSGSKSGGTAVSWQAQFASRLSTYRRIAL